MPSLNLDLDYFDHPKTRRLIGLLGQNSELLPIRLWAYVGKHHPDTGELRGYSASEVESVCGWRGQTGKMIEALCKSGIEFLEPIEGGYRVHDWLEHEGHLIAFKKRAKDAAEKRWGKISPENQQLEDATSNASSIAKRKPKHCSVPTVPTILTNPPPPPLGDDKPKAENPTPQKKMGPPEFEESNIESGLGLCGEEGFSTFKLPENLDNPDFRDSWRDWVEFREERKPKITTKAAKSQLKTCKEWGIDRSIAAIKFSISSSYQGLFEPKTPFKPSPKPYIDGPEDFVPNHIMTERDLELNKISYFRDVRAKEIVAEMGITYLEAKRIACHEIPSPE